jgi:stage V sporulation protein R
MTKTQPISTTSDWSYDLLEEYYAHIEKIASEKFNLKVYPNQLEIISSEQMLEGYSTHAMPLYYDHWSTGMKFVEELEAYKRGYMGLAYEVVINSNPCIVYLMQENTMLMQILVIAHAAFGHNHFFKNNYLFKQWTDAEAIIDYLVFAKKYIRDQEEIYGVDAVEEVLDACHALQLYGIDKYKRPHEMTRIERKSKKEKRENWEQQQINVLWSTIPEKENNGLFYINATKEQENPFPDSPQENLLYFVEKNAPFLPMWKRELIRIVRKMAQYFYPQMQTRLMNEGFATFMHYHIVQELYDKNIIGDGYMIEFFKNHTNVIKQLDYDNKLYNGINVYALGFAMYMDIKRISMEPTEEDRQWFKNKSWVGNGKWLDNILWAAANFKDESFITEYLSPKIMREFHLFVVLDDDRDPKLEISAIHNDRGYKIVREETAKQYNFGVNVPELQVALGGVNVQGDRSLTLQHIMRDRRPLDEGTATETLKLMRTLWGYDVKLESIDNGKVKALYEIKSDEALLAKRIH